MKPFHFKWVLVLALLGWGLLVYSNTLSNSFHFDDFPQLVYNNAVKDIHKPGRIWQFWPTRFVTNLTFALNYHWGATNVLGYHLVNLFLHLASTILVLWLINQIFPSASPWLSFFVAAIFLLHPIQTQPVNYIIQRAVLLASFFYLASLNLYLKARSLIDKAPGAKTWIKYYGAALAAGILAMLSKEMAAGLSLMVCFFEFFFFRGSASRRWMVAPFFMMAMVLIVLPWCHTSSHAYGGNQATSYTYFLTQIKVLVTYLRLLVIPIHQSVDYVYPLAKSPFEIPVALSGFFLLLVLSAGVVLKDKFPMLSVGIFWFFITLLPESSFVPINDVIVEHRLYLATVGFGIFLASAVFYIFKDSNFLALRVLFLLLGAYSFMTYQRNRVWESEFTLWDDAVHKSPLDQRAYLNRGAIYQQRGDLDHALADYNMVIGLGSVDAVTLSNRGVIFEDKGAYDLAMANFNLAIKINPNYAGTYENRARLYFLMHKSTQARQDLKKAQMLMGAPKR